MSTFVLIHGAGDYGWSWHLVEKELSARGHNVVVPDLPADDESLTLTDYANAATQLVGDHDHLIVVGHSFGGFTAPIVADRLAADALILLAGMIPAPGESPDDWWTNTGYSAAVEVQSARDGGLTGNSDPFISFMHDLPRELAEEAILHQQSHPSANSCNAEWPLAVWPNMPTRFILCRDDRFFPADFFRRLVPERLGIIPEEIDGSHCVALSRPQELVRMLLNS